MLCASHVPWARRLDVLEAELVYAKGGVEQTGLAITLADTLGWGAWAWRRRRQETTAPPGKGRSTVVRRRR